MSIALAELIYVLEPALWKGEVHWGVLELVPRYQFDETS